MPARAAGTAAGWSDPWSAASGFRLSGPAERIVRVAVDGHEETVRVVFLPGGPAIRYGRDTTLARPELADEVAEDSPAGTAGGEVIRLHARLRPADLHRLIATAPDGTVFALGEGRAVRVELVDELARRAEDLEGEGVAVAPMYGRIIAVHVAEGDRVARGQPLFAIEAMKMEHTVAAAIDGVVTAVSHGAGEQVAEGVAVVTISSTDETPENAPGLPAGEAMVPAAAD